MSIDAVRKLVESRGCCGIAFVSMMAIVAGMFIVQGSCSKGMRADQVNHGQAKSIVIVKAGAMEITAEQVEKLVDQQEAGARQSGQPVTPFQTTQLTGQVLTSLVDQGAVLQLAETSGVKLSDDDIRKQASESLENQIMMFKLQAQMQQKLKTSPTDADIEKMIGKTLKEVRDEQSKKIEDGIKNPSERQALVAGLAKPIIEKAIASRMTPSESEVKSQYQTLETKRIFIPAKTGATDDSAAKARAALDEIKKGMSFEAAIDRFSQDAPQKGKRLSEVTTPMFGASLAADASLQVLLKLKGGDTSDVVKVPTGSAIFKVISVKSSLPADYDKKKVDYAKSYSASKARAQVDADLEKIRKDMKVEWVSKGYQSAFDLVKSFNTGGDPAARNKAIADVEKEAAAAVASDDVGARIAASVRYSASTMLYMAAKPEEKPKMAADRMEALEQALKVTDGFQIRLELADLYADAKKGPEASKNLLEAARSNNDTDTAGQSNFNTINARVDKFKKAGFLTADDEKGINSEQDRWKKDKAAQDQQDAERKKFEEEDRKKAEAAKAKDVKVRTTTETPAPASDKAKAGK